MKTKLSYSPAQIEFFDSKLMEGFHQLRLKKGLTGDIILKLNGIEFRKLILKAKRETYKKFPRNTKLLHSIENLKQEGNKTVEKELLEAIVEAVEKIS